MAYIKFGDCYTIRQTEIKMTVKYSGLYGNTIYINILLFAKLNVHQFTSTFQFAKLYVCQIYHIYSTSFQNPVTYNYVCMYVCIYCDVCMYVYMYLCMYSVSMYVP